MNTTFKNSTVKQKFLLLRFLKEEKIVISVAFHENSKTHDYFKKNYKKQYGSKKTGSNMVNIDSKKLYLYGSVHKLDEEAKMVTIRRFKLTSYHEEHEWKSDDTYHGNSKYTPVLTKIPISMMESFQFLEKKY